MPSKRKVYRQRRKVAKETVLASKWFEGNFYAFSSEKMHRYSKKYGVGVQKPTAVRTKEINGKTFSQIYYKPIEAGEVWD